MILLIELIHAVGKVRFKIYDFANRTYPSSGALVSKSSAQLVAKTVTKYTLA